MTNYLVQFWNRESGWLHSHKNVDVETDHPDEIAKAAVEAVKNDTGEDLSRYRASVVNETGEGVPVPEDKPAEDKPAEDTPGEDAEDRKAYEEWKSSQKKPAAAPVVAIPPVEDPSA